MSDAAIVMSEGRMESSVAYAICRMSDIPSQKARGFQLMIVGDDGTPRPWSIFVVRWGRQVFGYVNKCPHDGVNLDWERNQFLDPERHPADVRQARRTVRTRHRHLRGRPLQGPQPHARGVDRPGRRHLRHRRHAGRG